MVALAWKEHICQGMVVRVISRILWCDLGGGLTGIEMSMNDVEGVQVPPLAKVIGAWLRHVQQGYCAEDQ